MKPLHCITVTLCLISALSLPVSAGILTGPFLQNAGSDKMTVMWESDVEEAAWVEYVESGAAATNRLDLTGSHHSINAKSLWYVAELTALKTDTEYSYRVGMGDLIDRGGTFRTFPTNSGPFSFIMYADPQDGTRGHERVAAQFLKYNPRFIICAGDLIVADYEDDTPEHWRRVFFKPLEEVIRNVPLFVSRGNHDPRRSDEAFTQYFSNPGDGLNYHFSCGHAQFLGIDSSGHRTKGYKEADIFRAIKDAFAGANPGWRFVYLHHPMYNIAHHNSKWGRYTVLPELHNYNVDVVMAGHAHLYERFFPIAAGAYDNPRPITHLVVGPGGGEERSSQDNALLAKHRGYAYNFLVVTLDGPKLSAMAYDVRNSNVLDEFTFTQVGELYDDAYMAQVISRRHEQGPVEAFAGGTARVAGPFGNAYEFKPWGSMLGVRPAKRFNDEQGTIEFWVDGVQGAEWVNIASDHEIFSQHHLYRAKLRQWVTDGITNREYGVAYETVVGATTNRIVQSLPTNGWNHIMATYDESAGQMTLSVNGGTPVQGPYIKTGCARASVIGIGGQADRSIGLGAYCMGLIDEVRVSNIIREPHMQTAAFKVDDATIMLLRFEEPKGEIPRDDANPWYGSLTR